MQQREMFTSSPLRVSPPSDIAEPRLWIRRFVIWSQPNEVLQSITLRPGLNIVWSPDPADAHEEATPPEGPGHGAGKTLLARLLRYCLGERSFAPEDQRRKISAKFKDGRVGAEVVIDRVPWAVVRSIGVAAHDVVLERASLDSAVAQVSPTGIEALVEALARAFLPSALANILASSTEDAWLLVLAWLARDQDCHFKDLTSWRATESESGSPASGMSKGRATNVVRALLGALTSDEHRVENEIARLDAERTASRELHGRDDIWREQAVERLAGTLALDADGFTNVPLVGEFLRGRLAERARPRQVVPIASTPVSVLTKRQRATVAEVERLRGELKAAKKDVTVARAAQLMLEGETPGIEAELDGAERPICKICEVPIKRAIADRCGLSHRLTDVETVRERRRRNIADLKKAREDEEQASRHVDEINAQLKLARMQRVRAIRELDRGVREESERSDSWYESRRIRDDIAELERCLERMRLTNERIAKLDDEIVQLREAMRAARKRHASIFGAITVHFDALVRELLGNGAKGTVTNDGDGIHLGVEYGGDRTAAAINSMKVLLFDLAALLRSVEGKTHLPALVVHDSPRESDLGLSIYDRVFHLICTIENETKSPALPPFQYIVTTTTRPPRSVAVKPWLILELAGTPASQRLLKHDL